MACAFADPERLVGKKRRNELAAAETSLCYLTRGKFGEDQNDDGFIDTVGYRTQGKVA